MTSGRTIGRNIIANTVGRVWSAVSNIIFVPFYIKLLGGDGYGLVVSYATMFAALQVLDAGLSSALSRELAARLVRPNIRGKPSDSLVDLARTVEVISWGSALVIGAVIIAIAPTIARRWLQVPPELQRHTADSIRLIGAVIAVQWPSMTYQGALMGLQSQVRLNVTRMVSAIIQAIGALCVLRFVSATTEAYFCWVLIIQAVNSIWLRHLVWANLWSITQRVGRFRWTEVLGVRRFAGGVASIALLSAMLTQTDKIVLSKFVSITEFGLYGVAYTVAGVLGLFAQPVLAGMLPRLTQLFESKNSAELRYLYPLGCELVAFLCVPVWMILTFHSQELMLLWLRSPDEASPVALLLPLLCTGTLANALVTLPYGLQLASAWTSLSIIKNIVTTAVALPALILVIPRYGAVGAASIWLAINCGYIVAEIPIVHRRLPIGSVWSWYWRSVILPVAIGGGVGLISRQFMITGASKLGVLGSLCGWALVTATMLLLGLPGLRQFLIGKISEYRAFRATKS